MKVWITRDSDDDGEICGWKNEKGLIVLDGCWDTDCTSDINTTIDILDCLRAPVFKSLFGFTPRKGSCKQYELSLKELKQ